MTGRRNVCILADKKGMLERLIYERLNARQEESFDFQKVEAELADCGFNRLGLSDDWRGAGFIACYVDGKTFLKVQSKGHLTIDKKYNGSGA